MFDHKAFRSGASELLHQAMADAICELTDTWEPIEGGCVYQMLGSNKYFLRGVAAPVGLEDQKILLVQRCRHVF